MTYRIEKQLALDPNLEMRKESFSSEYFELAEAVKEGERHVLRHFKEAVLVYMTDGTEASSGTTEAETSEQGSRTDPIQKKPRH